MENCLIFQLNDQGHYAEALMTKGVLAPRGCMEQLKVCIFVPAHKILVLIAYVQMPPLNISSRASSLYFHLSLPLLPYFAYVRSEGSDESAQIRRLV